MGAVGYPPIFIALNLLGSAYLVHDATATGFSLITPRRSSPLLELARGGSKFFFHSSNPKRDRSSATRVARSFGSTMMISKDTLPESHSLSEPICWPEL